MKCARRWLCVLLSLLMLACRSVPDPTTRCASALALAQAQGWRAQHLHAGAFDLLTLGPLPTAAASPNVADSASLTIYLEGDGLAWLAPDVPSDDPTPLNPLALRLALAQPQGRAVWLARPCQYASAASAGCPRRYWTDARYAPEVIAATDLAISQLKTLYAATQIELVGYSGGGAVAALVAARRNDVTRLVTVAANLDIARWAQLLGLSPLHDSLNPADFAAHLQTTPQWLYVGADDAVVPAAVAESYAARFPVGQRPVISVQAGFDHDCCWVQSWPRLWAAAR
ncbi:alpha/beta hydrolase [Silvimonas sp. JCM 19000]